jgi:hypothetical protein
MDKNTVLSVSPSKDALILRQTILSNAGMKVISVFTLAEARFEIQMGRCGNLLMCYRLSSEQAGDIANLFRRYCPEGRIVFISDGTGQPTAPNEADASIPESGAPEHLLQAVRP